MTVLPFRRPVEKPAPIPVRLVPLSRPLLAMAVSLERDPLMAEMAEGELFAERALAVPPLCMAAIHDGNLVAVGGLIGHWPGRAEAWALVSSTADSRELVQAVRLCAAWLDQRQRNPMFRRLECYVRAAAAWRASFMRALQFERETTLQAWGPDGSDFDIYKRVR